MGVNLSGRSFLKLLDLTTEEIEYLLKLSKNFKDMKRAGVPHRYLEGKNIVLLFQKTSTRTRCAFEVGGMDLGMGVTYLDPGSSQMGTFQRTEQHSALLGLECIPTIMELLDLLAVCEQDMQGRCGDLRLSGHQTA